MQRSALSPGGASAVAPPDMSREAHIWMRGVCALFAVQLVGLTQTISALGPGIEGIWIIGFWIIASWIIVVYISGNWFYANWIATNWNPTNWISANWIRPFQVSGLPLAAIPDFSILLQIQMTSIPGRPALRGSVRA